MPILTSIWSWLGAPRFTGLGNEFSHPIQCPDCGHYRTYLDTITDDGKAWNFTCEGGCHWTVDTVTDNSQLMLRVTAWTGPGLYVTATPADRLESELREEYEMAEDERLSYE